MKSKEVRRRIRVRKRAVRTANKRQVKKSRG